MQLKLKPQGKFVLISASKPDAGPIVMGNFNNPDATRVHQMPSAIFRVVDVGEGRLCADGTIIPINLKPGDEVILAPDTPMGTPDRMVYGHDLHFIVELGAIIAVVEGRDGDKLPPPPPPEIVKGRMNTKALVQ